MQQSVPAKSMLITHNLERDYLSMLAHLLRHMFMRNLFQLHYVRLMMVF